MINSRIFIACVMEKKYKFCYVRMVDLENVLLMHNFVFNVLEQLIYSGFSRRFVESSHILSNNGCKLCSGNISFFRFFNFIHFWGKRKD